MDARSRAWWGTLALLVLLIVAYVDRTNLSILITNPAFLRHFGIAHNRVAQGALLSWFLIGYGLSALVLSPVYERFLGVRRGLALNTVVWALMTLAGPLAASFALLLGTRVVLGVSEGPQFSLNTMYVRQAFPAHSRGVPNAVWFLGVSLGLAVGFPLVTALLHGFGWRGSFYALGGLNLVIGLPLVLGLVREGSSLKAAPASLSRVALGALRAPGIWWVVLFEVANLTYLWGTSAWLPSYLLEARHFSLASMAVLSSLPFIATLAGTLAGGALADRLRRKSILWVVGGVGAAVFVTLAITVANHIVAALCLIAANGCFGLEEPIIPTVVQLLAPPESTGSSYGLANGIGNLVSAAAPAAMGGLIAAGGFAAGFGILIGAELLAAACGLGLLRHGAVAAGEAEAAGAAP